MNKGNLISIVLATIALAKIDLLSRLSYWGAFELGIKIVIFALPVLLLLGSAYLIIFLNKQLWAKVKEKKLIIAKKKRALRSKLIKRTKRLSRPITSPNLSC